MVFTMQFIYFICVRKIILNIMHMDILFFQVNTIRVAAVLSVLVLILLLLYLFYLTAYKNGNRTLHFRGKI